MEKRFVLFVFAWFFVFAGTLFGAFDAADCDDVFFRTRDLQKTREMLEKAAAEDSGNAEIFWRLSRNLIAETDAVPEKDKEKRLAGYALAENYADRSIALKESAEALHWKASAIGRTGQTNGPLNSLGKAKPMRALLEKVQNVYNADLSDSWYVLSMLYDKLPGGFISFGDKNIAISYIRRAIDTQDNARELHLRNYLELAEQLKNRGLSAAKRAKLAKKLKADFEKKVVPTEKFACYEGAFAGTVRPAWSSRAFGETSDEEEAREILKFALAVYAKKPSPAPYERALAEKIRKLAE